MQGPDVSVQEVEPLVVEVDLTHVDVTGRNILVTPLDSRILKSKLGQGQRLLKFLGLFIFVSHSVAVEQIFSGFKKALFKLDIRRGSIR